MKIYRFEKASLLTIIFSIFLCATCFSFSLKDVVRGAGDVAETGWRAATAPAEAVINTGKKATGIGRPESAFKPFKDLGRSAGNTIEGATQLISAPQQYIYNEVNEFVEEHGGDVGEFVFDIATFNQQLLNQVTVSSNMAIANALRGQNPLQITAGPLAAAIRAARNKHLAGARPLPQEVKRALTGLIPPQTLNIAKYCVGTVDITLPNFIGRGAQFMGNDYAVVVDDIIVFNDDPPSFSDASFWWTHEVAHVDQYRRWGVEKFAFRYIRDLGSDIENEADMIAQRKTGNRNLVGKAMLSSTVEQLGLHSRVITRPDSGGSNRSNAEFFIAQCFFPRDPFPGHYMVTNTHKIIAIDPINGNWVQVGWATPPLMPRVAWTYQTRMFRYAVFHDGAIVTYDQFNRPIQVGHVQRF
jgi:hypothetical protein